MSGGLEGCAAGIFALICDMTGVERAGVYLYSAGTRRLDLVCHYNLNAPLLVRMVTCERKSWQVRMALKGHPGYYDAGLLPPGAEEFSRREGFGSLAMIPLKYRSGMVGSLLLGFGGPIDSTCFERLIIEEIASRLARVLALHHARLRLAEAMEETLEALATPGLIRRDNLLESDIPVMLELLGGRLMEKIEHGCRVRELPFVDKKVSAAMEDIHSFIRLADGIRYLHEGRIPKLTYARRHPDTLQNSSAVQSAGDFRLEIAQWLRQEPGIQAARPGFLTGRYEPVTKPIRTANLEN